MSNSSFDFDWDEPFRKKEERRWDYWGHDLLYRQPSKSCARCKSRSWQIPLETYDEFNSLARIRAHERVRESSPDYDPQEDKYLKRLAREYDGDEYERRAARYIIKRYSKRK